MYALECKELIFLSYTCVFRVAFSEDLCKEIIQEVKTLYGSDTKPKLTRFRKEAKGLKKKIKDYAQHNVQFVCELPSIKGKTCTHDQVSGKPDFRIHEGSKTESSELVADLEGTLLMAKRVIREAFHLCRR
jgi:phage host-nuclease inhibitor protein Gam